MTPGIQVAYWKKCTLPWCLKYLNEQTNVNYEELCWWENNSKHWPGKSGLLSTTTTWKCLPDFFTCFSTCTINDELHNNSKQIEWCKKHRRWKFRGFLNVCVHFFVHFLTDWKQNKPDTYNPYTRILSPSLIFTLAKSRIACPAKIIRSSMKWSIASLRTDFAWNEQKQNNLK